LFRTTRAILKDSNEAEDVMQEAYVRAFVNLDQFAGEARFATWLTKIAVYEAFARLRRAKRQEDLPEPMDPTGDPERTAYGHELRSAIESAVDVLPPLYRTVFVLREIEGMSVAETADCLGITEENVKTRFHRARALLRVRLQRAIGAAASQAFAFLGDRCDRITNSVMERF
jgi:RNA polymerase sigma-70 factor (ECF subfamily)